MHARSQCCRCRQRFSVPPNAATILCPICKFQEIQSFERLKSHDRGQISFRSFISTAKTKISRSGTGSSKSDKSLNCKPSALSFSRSLSGLRPSRKRALLIGVTYKSSKHQLKGTIIDVKSIRNLLMDTFNFPGENILVLTEEESEQEFFPTKKNIENSFKWLVEDCKAGDSLVFYFSGHGISHLDYDGDESDGFDETICPVDFMEAGMISDDEIQSAICRPLGEGVTLNAIVDACHSGTVLDLPYVYSRKENKWESKKHRSKDEKQTNGGLAISIAACEDKQVAADTSSCFGKASMIGGAMTYILVEIVKKNPAITYGELLDSIHEHIEKANKEGCLPGKLKRVLNDLLSQKPQLCASEEFNVYGRYFNL